MDNKEYGMIIAKNLRRIMYDAGKTQAEVARDLKISKATLSSWMNGKRIPRMPNIDMLCHYFNVNRTDIMEEYASNESSLTDTSIEYYNPETYEMAQAIFDRPDLHALMKAAMDCEPDQIQSVADMLLRFKETNIDG